MANVQKSLDRVALSGGEIKDFTSFPDEMVEDYLSIHDDINSLGEAIDQIANENSVPATATSTGKKGQTALSSTHAYFCIATDTWKRVAISAW